MRDIVGCPATNFDLIKRKLGYLMPNTLSIKFYLGFVL